VPHQIKHTTYSECKSLCNFAICDFTKAVPELNLSMTALHFSNACRYKYWVTKESRWKEKQDVRQIVDGEMTRVNKL
jgi:hypothetical protein